MGFEEEDFYQGSRLFAKVQARLYHTGVVEHHQLAFGYEVR